MDNLRKHFITTVLSLVTFLPAMAHDFTVVSNGKTIYYNITSDYTCEVTYNGERYSDDTNRYAGSVIIPSMVEHDGKTYLVTAIGDYAFAECHQLKSLVVGAFVQSIGTGAIYNCQLLQKLTLLPDDVPQGLRLSLNIIPYLGRIIYIPNSRYHNSVFGVNEVRMYPRLDEFFDVNGIRYVPLDNYSCEAIDCTYDDNIHDITLCETVTHDGKEMTVESINSYLLANNTAVKTICTSFDIPELFARDCTALTTVYIAKQVTSVGGGAFIGCKSIRQMHVDPTTPPTCGSKVFDDIEKSSCTLYVPELSIPDYKAAEGWRDFTFFSSSDLLNSINDIDKEGIHVRIGTDNVSIEGTVRGLLAAIYTLAGTLVSKSATCDGTTVIPLAPSLSAHETYILKYGGKSMKIHF